MHEGEIHPDFAKNLLRKMSRATSQLQRQHIDISTVMMSVCRTRQIHLKTPE